MCCIFRFKIESAEHDGEVLLMVVDVQEETLKPRKTLYDQKSGHIAQAKFSHNVVVGECFVFGDLTIGVKSLVTGSGPQ